MNMNNHDSQFSFSSRYIVGCCIFRRRKAALESDSDESDSDIEEAEKADSNPDPSKPKPYQIHHA